MNREIKFRAWDGQHITPPFTSDHFGNLNNAVADCEKAYGELMQFTGLKDKNGKEIYEGDIVTEGYNEKYGRYEVKWEKCGFNLDTGGDFGSWEVIGNIHENPSLLTPESK